MTLKENKWTLKNDTILHIPKGKEEVVYCEEYVKEAVLKFHQRLIDDEAVFNGLLDEKEYCKKYDLNNIFDETITDYYIKIFGDFNK